MNNLNTLFLLSATLLFVACDRSAMDETPSSDQTITVSTCIIPSSSTRIETDGTGRGSFTIGDTISLFLNGNAREISLTQSGWAPPIYRHEIGYSQVAATAFYPVIRIGSEEHSTIHTHQVATDQSTLENYRKSDILVARSSISPESHSLDLTFSHLMSRLTVNLSSDGSFTQEELSKARIIVKSLDRITIDCMTGEISTAPEVSMSYITMQSHASGQYSVILPPQPINESWKTENWIEIGIDGKTFGYKAPDTFETQTAFSVLESGKEVRLNISLKKEEEQPNDWKDKTVWVYGITPPPYDTWGYIATNPYQIKGLKWSPGCGWYDCNKVDPYNKLGNIDSQMCWAAASSNMLYWWLDQNDDYITRYGKYTGPSHYNNSIDCDIFQLYKQEFGNVGNDVAAALSWFITGRHGISDRDGAGFFKEVFGSVHVARIINVDGQISLSDELKKALSQKEAIECTFDFPGRIVHAITIWGVEFDSQGEACAIYITDNNDRDYDEQEEFTDYLGRPITQAGIMRKMIQKKSDGFYMESSIPNDFAYKIITINALGLMRDQWDAYFSSLQQTLQQKGDD